MAFLGNQGDPAVWPFPIPVHGYCGNHHIHQLVTTLEQRWLRSMNWYCIEANFHRHKCFANLHKKKHEKTHAKTEFSQFIVSQQGSKIWSHPLQFIWQEINISSMDRWFIAMNWSNLCLLDCSTPYTKVSSLRDLVVWCATMCSACHYIAANWWCSI